MSLWKLYFLSLLASAFEEYGITGNEAQHLQDILAREGLAKGKRSLTNLVQTTFDYVKQAIRPAEVEGGVELDPLTQMPKGFKGKIVFREPTGEAKAAGLESIDSLLTLADEALHNNSDYVVWVLLDRLDVAFVENAQLEQNALRALFRVYLDLLGLKNIHLKIFLRTDIWNRITKEGFREASHITRHVTISWNRTSLLNLIVRRALHNEALLKHYGVTEDVLDSVDAQEKFFFRMFPDQVEVGPNKPKTLDWLLSRTRDGTQMNAPRELIFKFTFLNSLRIARQMRRYELGEARSARQMRRYELGEPDPDGETLFARAAFKESLPEVSKAVEKFSDLSLKFSKARPRITPKRYPELRTDWPD